MPQTSLPPSLKPGNGWSRLKQEYGAGFVAEGTEECILPNSLPEGVEDEDETLLAMVESIAEDDPGVKYLKTELELSAFNFERKGREELGCRCEDLIWNNRNQYTLTGELEFNMHKNYRGPGLEWRPFLTLYSPYDPPIYEFEVGRAGHLFYFRAFSTTRKENDR